jgi:hypothetical protein
VSLANDLSAFYHVSQNEMFTRFKAAVLDARGEAVDQFGISIKMNAMQNFMRMKGDTRSYRMIPEEEKLLLRLEKVQKDMSEMGAVGASVSRSGLYQGTVSRYQSGVFELKNAIGKALMPVAQTILEGGVMLFKGASKLVDNSGVVGKFAMVLAGVGAALFPILGTISAFKYIGGSATVVAAFAGIKAVLVAMGSVVGGGLLAGLAIATAAIAGLSLIFGDIATWKLGGKSVIGRIFGDYKKHFGVDEEGRDLPTSTYSKAKTSFENLITPIKYGWEFFKDGWFGWISLANGDIDGAKREFGKWVTDIGLFFRSIVRLAEIVALQFLEIPMAIGRKVSEFVWGKEEEPKQPSMSWGEAQRGTTRDESDWMRMARGKTETYKPYVVYFNQTISADAAISKDTVKEWTMKSITDSLRLGM